MDNINKKLCFLRGVYDFLEHRQTPSVDYAGDLEKLYVWGCGYYAVSKEISRLVKETESISEAEFHNAVFNTREVLVEDMLRKMGFGF